MVDRSESFFQLCSAALSPLAYNFVHLLYIAVITCMGGRALHIGYVPDRFPSTYDVTVINGSSSCS